MMEPEDIEVDVAKLAEAISKSQDKVHFQAIDDAIRVVKAASTNTGYAKTEVIISRLEALRNRKNGP